jgi:hypothetical protein
LCATGGLAAEPLGQSWLADSPLNIVDRLGIPIATDNTTTPAYLLDNGKGDTYPEQYTAYNAANSLSPTPIAAGGAMILKSTKTDKWCRLAPVAGTVPEMQGMQCDLDSPTGATEFQYTGSGIIYNGIPLVPEVSTL